MRPLPERRTGPVWPPVLTPAHALPQPLPGAAIFEAFSDAAPPDALLPGETGNTAGGAAGAARGSWWLRLAEAGRLLSDRAFTVVLLPPLSKGAGGDTSRGYDAYDYYDFGGLEQCGSVGTLWGCEEELRGALRQLRSLGLHCVVDFPVTRCAGGALEASGRAPPTWTDFAAAGSRRFKRDRSCFHPCEFSEEGAAAAPLASGPGQHVSLCLTHPHVRQQVALCLSHLARELGVTGARWVECASVPPGLVGECHAAEPLAPLHIAQPRWDPEEGADSEAGLRVWAAGCPAALVMDYPLWEALVGAVLAPPPAPANRGAADPLGVLAAAGLCRLPDVGSRAVVFVSCAATEGALRELGVPPQRRMLGYAYTLGVGLGVPLVALTDYCGVPGRLGPRIDRLRDVLRRYAAHSAPAEELCCGDGVVALRRPPGRVLPRVGLYEAPGCFVLLNTGDSPREICVGVPAGCQYADAADPAAALPAAPPPPAPPDAGVRMLRAVVPPASYALYVPLPAG